MHRHPKKDSALSEQTISYEVPKLIQLCTFMKMTWLFNEIGNGCLIRTHLSIAYKESCAERDIKILIYFYILYLNWNQNNEDVLHLFYVILFYLICLPSDNARI